MVDSLYIKNLKAKAKQLCRRQDLKHSEALDNIAQKEGFAGWHELMNTPVWILEGCFYGIDKEFEEPYDLNLAPFEELSGKDLEDAIRFVCKTQKHKFNFEKLRLYRFTKLTDVGFCDFNDIDSIGEATNLMGHFQSYLSVAFVFFKGKSYILCPEKSKLHKVVQIVETPMEKREIVDYYREIIFSDKQSSDKLEIYQELIFPELTKESFERKVYCPHCKQEYLLKETKIVQDESRDTFVFCKNFPECFGQGRDLEYLE